MSEKRCKHGTVINELTLMGHISHSALLNLKNIQLVFYYLVCPLPNQEKNSLHLLVTLLLSLTLWQ